MSILADKFRLEVSKLKDVRMKSESGFETGYSTGLLSFDFSLGCKVFVNDRKTGHQYGYYSVGITNGSISLIIGRSGSGKSSLALSIAANIIRPFKTSCIFEDNIEGGSTFVRRQVMMGFTTEEMEKRVISRNAGIHTEGLYNRIKMIHDIKMNDIETYRYNTGLPDTQGNPVYQLEPTVYLIDSLALLLPEKYTEEDELSGQMSATAAARANASLFKRLIPLCKSANIIVLVINHINQKVELNQFQATKAQVSYLKQNEVLPGGNAPIYLANTLIRVDDRSKLKSSEGFGIDGSIVDLVLIKSRTNKSNKSVPAVFDQQTGFDNELSLFVMLKDAGKVKGAGAYLYLDGYDHIKFSQKTFKQKLFENEELKEAFTSMVVQHLQEEIDSEYSNIQSSMDRHEQRMSLNSEMLDRVNANMRGQVI